MDECKIVSKSEIDKLLKQEPVSGKHQLESLKSLFSSKQIPFGIIEDVKVEGGEAEAHLCAGDLWLVLEGEVEFEYGGELIDKWAREGSNGNELGGKGIRGGKKVKLGTGDWFWIPPGQPHVHYADFVRMIIIKIPKS